MKHFFLLLLLFFIAACSLFTACGAKNGAVESSGSPKNMEGEPQFDIAGFEVFLKATTEADLPYLASADGVRSDIPCFTVTKKTKSWQTKNPSVLEDLSKRDSAIQKAVMAWTRDELLPSGVQPNIEASWRVELKKPQIVHANLDHIRFQEDEQCIDETTATLPALSKTVTTLFGALELNFESEIPLEATVLKKMRQTAKKGPFRLKTTRYEYPRATDASGEPLKDEKGRPLFQGPAGEHLLRHKIPGIKNRPVFKWKLVFNRPLFVAYGDLPSDVWSRELDPIQCSVNLIFDDATPRIPECSGAKDAGFGITNSGSPDTVTVRVTADGVTVSKEVSFNTREMIQVAGRVIVWVKPKKLEEGALLNVDSLVLAPGSGTDDAVKSFVKRKKRPPKRKSNKPKDDPFIPPISY
ncbi:MAG: hypothetical protein GY847_13325 [Proteobacteria bacterium]|nr:hypothetical protein [Pseudomonadota bacterium]